MKSNHSFIERKQCDLYEVAAAYLMVGWLVLQFASAILPTLHFPESPANTSVALILLGFPIAFVISSAFEITAEGMKPTASITVHEYLPYCHGRKFAWTLTCSSETLPAVAK